MVFALEIAARNNKYLALLYLYEDNLLLLRSSTRLAGFHLFRVGELRAK